MAKRTSKKTAGPPKFSGEEKFVAIVGSEPFLLTEYTRQLREAIEKTVDTEVDTINFDGSRVELAELFDELRSMGLMMQHKLIVIDPAEDFVKTHRAALERYAAKPEPTATLLLRAGKWNKGNLDKAIANVGQIVQCADPTAAQAEKWLAGRARNSYQVTLETNAARMLVSRIGADLGRLDGELAKLSAGAPDGQPVTTELVTALVGRSGDNEYAWGRMQDAILSGRSDVALDAVYELTELASMHPIPLLRAASDLSIKMAQAAQMLADRRSEFEICKTLKIWPNSRHQPFLQMARKHGKAGTAALAAKIVDLDRRSKSGFGEARRSLEQFCVLLTR